LSEDSLEDKALALIKSRPAGILQSELWKHLDIDSRKCSRVIAKLEAEGKIKRTWETVKGTRTYRISYLPQKKEAPKKEVDFSLILAKEHVAPCIGCTYECEPDYCPDLGNWIELLAKVAAQETPKAVKAPAVKARAPEKAVAVEEEVVVMAKGKKAVKAPAVKARAPEKVAVKEVVVVAKAKKAVKAPAVKAAKVEKIAKKEAPKAIAIKKSVKPAKVTITRPSKAVKSTKKSKK
jgi:hypothetical protein